MCRSIECTKRYCSALSYLIVLTIFTCIDKCSVPPGKPQELDHNLLDRAAGLMARAVTPMVIPATS